jgi:hypothetical protein
MRGADREFTSKSQPRLHGAALAIGGASDLPLETRWQVVSGPGTVTFADANALETDVSFSAPGSYLLRLSAAQGAAVEEDDVRLSVYEAETSLIIRDQRLGSAGAFHLTPWKSDLKIEQFTGDTLNVSVQRRRLSGSGLLGERWHLSFRAPLGEALTTKTYTTSPQPGGTASAAMHIGGSPGGVGQGTFTITELKVNATGAVTALRLSFSQTASSALENQPGMPLQGELRWRADMTAIPANRAPNTYAGGLRYSPPGRSLTLRGIMEDDVLPAGQALRSHWEFVSGPEEVVITPGSNTVSAAFGKAGTYKLRFVASDGELTGSDELTVIVSRQTETFSGYATGNGQLYGQFKATVLANGRFTATVMLGSDRVPISGTLVGDRWSKSYPLRDFQTLDIELVRSVEDGVLYGTFSFGDTTLELHARQTVSAYLKATSLQSRYAGAYTWFSEAPAGGPAGYSHGTVQVNKAGGCRVVGHLADGVTFAYGGALGLDSSLPLYWIRGKEILAGPVNFAEPPEFGLSFAGRLLWSRAANRRDPRFPNGFGLYTRIIGALYRAPRPGYNLLTNEAGPVAIETAANTSSWPNERLDNPTLKPNGATVPLPGYQLQADPRTGLFRGTLLDPSGKKRAFKGAFLQNGRLGAGYFLTEKGVGSVEIRVPPGSPVQTP